MIIRLLSVLLLFIFHGHATASWPSCGSVDVYPGSDWPVPSASDWDKSLLEEAESYSTSQSDAAVMVVHRGRLVARWGDISEPKLVQSVRKQLLSSLVGLEVSAGRLALDDTLQELGIDDSEPSLTPAERRATLRDLLESRSGIFHSAHYEVGSWKRIRGKLQDLEAESGEADALEPGEYWFYNNWDFNTVGTIVKESAGRNIGPYFKEAVVGRLGMQDFQVGHVEYTGNGDMSAWMMDNNSEHPAYMFRISARDLARYGLLWLGCGRWDQEQILPEDWVLASIRGRDTLEGASSEGFQKDFGHFGYLWWVDRDGRRTHSGLPEDLNLYYGSGNGGHRLVIIPSLNLVVAHVVDTPGGLGIFSQARRRLFGPDLSYQQVAAVVSRIIAAHPARRGGI